MSVDDDNSVYVGGLSYEATENDLRRAFDLYGGVVAVKMVNNREVGGKCYGFVTFTNPRSAVDAINEMNGRTIGGRVVRVNEVRTRGGRAASQCENFRRVVGRDNDWDRDNDHIRDRDRDRDRFRDRNTEHARDRDRDRDNERGRDFHRAKDESFEQGWDCSVHDQEHARDHDLDWERDCDMLEEDRVMNKTRNHEAIRDKEQHLRDRPSDRLNDRCSRYLSSNSGDEYEHQVKEELEMSIQKSKELHKELELINGKVDEKGQHVSILQKKFQKREDALAAAKKLTSQRQSMLVKLQRGFQHSQDISERLKGAELELKFLVDTAMAEVDTGEDTANRGASGMNVVAL